jgi:hypothetical protein
LARALCQVAFEVVAFVDGDARAVVVPVEASLQVARGLGVCLAVDETL